MERFHIVNLSQEAYWSLWEIKYTSDSNWFLLLAGGHSEAAITSLALVSGNLHCWVHVHLVLHSFSHQSQFWGGWWLANVNWRSHFVFLVIYCLFCGGCSLVVLTYDTKISILCAHCHMAIPMPLPQTPCLRNVLNTVLVDEQMQ